MQYVRVYSRNSWAQLRFLGSKQTAHTDGEIGLLRTVFGNPWIVRALRRKLSVVLSEI